MTILEYQALTKEEFTKIACELAKKIKKPQFICLYGNLGSGKTFFCQQFIKQLDPKIKNVTSPSYNIAIKYEIKPLPILHVDLYRIKNTSEILDLSIVEYQEDHIILVEWADYLKDFKPQETIDIFITINKKDSNLRDIKIIYNT